MLAPRNLGVQLFQQTQSGSVLVGDLGNAVVKPLTTPWPPGSFPGAFTVFFDFTPVRPITLIPSSDYTLVLSMPAESPVGAHLLFSKTSAYVSRGGWTMSRTTSGNPFLDKFEEYLVIAVNATLIKSPATVTFGNLVQIYDGAAKHVSVTTKPSGLTVKVTYNGSSDAPTETGTYDVIGTIDDLNYSGSSTNTMRIGIPPTILVQPASRTNHPGTMATFNVVADGTSPLFYQWRKDGIDRVDGNSSIYTLTNVQLSDQGFYSVAISNVFGGVISADAQLTANSKPIADASATRLSVISVNGSNAVVVLDGSRSQDPDGNPLRYTWSNSDSGTVLASGVVAAAVLPLGTNRITLTVSDGLETDQTIRIIDIVAATQVLDRLIEAAREAAPKQWLLAHLRAALALLERGNLPTAINQLRVFQNQVRALAPRLNPTAAQALLEESDRIILALSGGSATRGKVEISTRRNAKLHLDVSGDPGQIYIIEASYDLVNWEKIGVARCQNGSNFTFEDNAGSARARYYRVSTP